MNEEDTLVFFSVDRENKEVGLLLGDWNVKLKSNGKWEIF